MAELGKTRSIDMQDLELEVKQVHIKDGTNTDVIVRGATTSALSNDTIGTTTEDGFLEVEVGGTTYKIPFWADD